MNVHPDGTGDGLGGSAAGGNRRVYMPTRKKKLFLRARCE